MMNKSGMHKAFVRLQLLLKIRIIIQGPNVMNQTIFTKGKQCAAAPLVQMHAITDTYVEGMI